MTLLSVFSVKGAPGVTTLSCLLAAAWSGPGPVVLAEADPAGGDLAARFGLSSRVGWLSLATSMRRSEGPPSLDDHLQHLPGGLPVLVGARGDDRRSADSNEGTVVRTYAGPVEDSIGDAVDPSRGPTSGLTVVDLGRYFDGDTVSGSWLRRSDYSLLVVPGDASAAVNLRDRAPQLLDACDGRLGLVVLGGTYGCSDMADFTGIAGITNLPVEPSAAAAACGAPGSGRRLELSLLWAAVSKLADSLSQRLEVGATEIEVPIDPVDAMGGSDTPESAKASPRMRPSSSRRAKRARSRKGRRGAPSPEMEHAGDGDSTPVAPDEALLRVGE